MLAYSMAIWLFVRLWGFHAVRPYWPSWIRRVSDSCTGARALTFAVDDVDLLEALWLRTDMLTFNEERLELTNFLIWWILRSKLYIYSSVSAISVSISSTGLVVSLHSAPWVLRLSFQVQRPLCSARLSNPRRSWFPRICWEVLIQHTCVRCGRVSL